jgi:hypothetical protein
MLASAPSIMCLRSTRVPARREGLHPSLCILIEMVRRKDDDAEYRGDATGGERR